MMKSSILALVAVLALGVFALTGCSQNKGEDSNQTTTDTKSSSMNTDTQTSGSASDASQPSGQAEPVAFTNDKGQIVCPIDGGVIEDPSKAAGYQDYEGKRYYFCCEGCPEKFKADPEKYKNGKPADGESCCDPSKEAGH